MRTLVAVTIAALTALASTLCHAAPGFFKQEAAGSAWLSSPSKAPRQSAVPDRIVGKDGTVLDVQVDRFGRIAGLKSSRGNHYQFVFPNDFASAPSKVLVNGQERALPLFRSGAKAIYTDPDGGTLSDWYEGYVTGWSGCGCQGYAKDTEDFWNYVNAAGAIGASIGAAVSILSGDSYIAILVATGMGWTAGAGMAVSFYAGWQIGTWVYNDAIGWYFVAGQ